MKLLCDVYGKFFIISLALIGFMTITLKMQETVREEITMVNYK